MSDSFGESAAPGLDQPEHTLDSAVIGDDHTGFIQISESRIELLLPERKHTQISPAGWFSGREFGESHQALPGADVVGCLQRTQADIKRRDGIAILSS